MSTLNGLMQHAYNTVPHYRDLFDRHDLDAKRIYDVDDLAAIPALLKREIQENPSRFISSSYRLDQLIRERTSGSTTTPLTIYKSPQDLALERASLALYRHRKHHIAPTARYCVFHLFNRGEAGPNTDVVINNNRELALSIFMLRERLDEYCRHMTDFQPEWLFGPPTVLYLLGRYMKDRGVVLPKPIRYIELSGEILSDAHRDYIKKSFGCSVANLYGCTEVYGMAFDCPQGRLHCLQGNVVVEVIRGRDAVGFEKKGRVHVTGLNNRAMPLIRYDTGDEGIMHPGEVCGCGNRSPILEILAGRVTSHVLLGNDRVTSSGIFYYAVERLNAKLDNPILQFQIVQHSLGSFEALFVKDKHTSCSSDELTGRFLEEMREFGIDRAQWTIGFAEELLPDRATGKLEFFESRIPEGDPRAAKASEDLPQEPCP